jgi:hypothetical protein
MDTSKEVRGDRQGVAIIFGFIFLGVQPHANSPIARTPTTSKGKQNQLLVRQRWLARLEAQFNDTLGRKPNPETRSQ